MDLDEVLDDFGLGPYQITVSVIMGFVLMYSNISPLSFAITASDLKYRCKIPFCDLNDTEYEQKWLPYAIRFVDNEPANKCKMFKMNHKHTNSTYYDVGNSTCLPDLFYETEEQCDKWVFGEPGKSILNDFHLMCNENKWKLSFVGTVNSIGQFIGLPLAGYISDIYIHVWFWLLTFRTRCRIHLQSLYAFNHTNLETAATKTKHGYIRKTKRRSKTISFGLKSHSSLRSKVTYGRRRVLVFGSVLSALFGTVRSFTVDYWSFILFELLDSISSSGVYAATFVLGLEIVSPKARARISSLMGCFYPLGAVVMGFTAYKVLEWRQVLRIVYLPGVLILGCLWYIPESIRWLQTQNRKTEMAKILAYIASSNGKEIPLDIKNAFSNPNSSISIKNDESLSFGKTIKKIINSKEMFMRIINCSFCWTTITFVYYGLSLTSVEFYGDKYLNFMLTNAIEVPAYLISWYFLEHYSRRKTQAYSFHLSGVSCILVNLISPDYMQLKLAVFLSCKFAISVAFNNMYVYTAEMFPTELRMSLLGLVSMIGRFGSMMAPQMSLLAILYRKDLPLFLFGIVSFVAGMITYYFPETKDQKLPDTIGEAEKVGET